MSDYKDGFEDGIKFAREVIISNVRKWSDDSANDNESVILEEVADKIEFGTLKDDL